MFICISYGRFVRKDLSCVRVRGMYNLQQLGISRIITYDMLGQGLDLLKRNDVLSAILQCLAHGKYRRDVPLIWMCRGWDRELSSFDHILCLHRPLPLNHKNRVLLKVNYGRVLLNYSRRLDLNNNRIMNRLQLQEKMERPPPLWLLALWYKRH